MNFSDFYKTMASVHVDAEGRAVYITANRFSYVIEEGRVTIGDTGLVVQTDSYIDTIAFYEGEDVSYRDGVIWTYTESESWFDGCRGTGWAYYDASQNRWVLEYEDPNTYNYIYN